jgi:hypothetical protein
MTCHLRVLLGCAFVLLAACDPVLTNEIDALGSEVNGVDTGPLHRPGQPCLLCHDGASGDPTQFSVAGTVFMKATGTKPAQRATIELQGADGMKFNATTNAAGNFYVSPGQFEPKFPLEVKVHYQSETITMETLIGGDGSCAGCHEDPAGPDSPGHVFVMLDDGGVPP